MMQLPLAAEIGDFAVDEDCLVVDSRRLTDIAADIGRTPFYLYSSARVEARIRQLRDALPETVHVRYAVKANPMPELVTRVAALTDGLDVASAGELDTALASGMAPEHISFAGPGKSVEELRAAVDAGILVNVESPRELERLQEIARETGQRPRAAIRVNPDFELKKSGMKMAGGPKQFGIDAETVPGVLAAWPDSIDFQGFHIFSGSQNLDSEIICDVQSKSVDLALSLSTHAPCPPRIINIGGGFGIPYFPADRALDLAPVGRNLAGLVERLATACPQAHLAVELGRYIVGEAGLYVCRVRERKLSRGKVFLVTDGGMHHHLAASGNFGQVIRRNFPVLVGNRVTGRERETVSVVGPLCTPLDLLADNMEMARAEEGDLIVVFQSGAYGLTASPIHFLSHPVAVERLL